MEVLETKAVLNSVMEKKNRISWCDIYKGIVIILVVVGHATGKFNQYIYQFHMAAFFLISGYTGNIYKKSLLEIIIEKFYKLMLPYIFINFIGEILFWILQKMDTLRYISTTQMPQTLAETIVKHTHADWFGAMWFLPILYATTICVKIIMCLAGESKIRIIIFSLVIFVLAENSIINNGLKSQWMLVGIAQWFMICGILIKRIKINEISNVHGGIAICIIGVLWYLSRKYISGAIVDWPSGKFNGIIDLYIPVYGVFLVAIVSVLLSRISQIEKCLCYLGKRTMEIMCFHFIGFKVAYVCLCCMKIMSWSELYCLTPGASVSQWWWLIVIVAIWFSIVMWNLLNKNKTLNFLLGGYRAKDITLYVYNSTVGKIKEKNKNTFDSVEKIVNKCRKHIAKINRKKVDKVVFIILCIIGGILIIGRMSNYCGTVTIHFPDKQHIAEYGSGWLDQSDNEEYRWVQNESELNVMLMDQNTISIKGYIPANVEGASYFIIKINNEIVCKMTVSNDMELNVTQDISSYIKRNKKNNIVFQFDGIRKPKQNDVDIREFSALISEIQFY